MDHIGTLVQLAVPQPEQAADWLTENLFFTPFGCSGTAVLVQSGTLLLELVSDPTGDVSSGNTPFGFDHIALRTGCIEQALEHCRARGLELELNGDSAFSNPRMWAGGARYFNIRSPFGVKFEACERVGTEVSAEAPICGLCHLGMCVDDFAACRRFLVSLGFTCEWPEFQIVSPGNRVRCEILSLPGCTVEVYSHSDPLCAKADSRPRLRGIALAGLHGSFAAPTGERFFALDTAAAPSSLGGRT